MWKQGMSYEDYFKWLNGSGKSIGDVRLLFGLIPAYPFFMFLGILLVILLCIIQFNKKKIPLREFEIGLVIVVPIGIIGASFFGKVFLPNYQSPTNWYKTFFFWQPGMSFFGALALGSTAGFGWFYKRSKVTQISMWVYFDIIIVNLLIGQALGRWGNLYNQEILGNNVSYDQISWLPNFIKHRLFYFPDFGYIKNDAGQSLPANWVQLYFDQELPGNWKDIRENGKTLDEIMQGVIQFKAPLFLYEGVANLMLWCLITFGIKNLNRLINYKNNPWNLYPEAFPCLLNPKFKTITEKKLKEWPTLAPIKYRQVTVKQANGQATSQLQMSLAQVWNKAYYWKTPDYEQTNQLLKEIDLFKKELYEAALLIKKSKQQYRSKVRKAKKTFNEKIKYAKQQQKNNLLILQKTFIEGEKKTYTSKLQTYKLNYSFEKRKLGVNPFARQIEKLNNPNNYKVLRSGVMTGCYIFGYGLIRIILETMRKPTEYMIANHSIANFVVLSLILLTGIIIIVLLQFIVPYKWREIGWLYEKSY